MGEGMSCALNEPSLRRCIRRKDLGNYAETLKKSLSRVPDTDRKGADTNLGLALAEEEFHPRLDELRMRKEFKFHGGSITCSKNPVRVVHGKNPHCLPYGLKGKAKVEQST